MAHYADLSPYEYYVREVDESVVNIGWLDSAHDYAKGVVSERFLENLWRLCHNRAQQSKGFHTCELCSDPKFPCTVKIDEDVLFLGSAEIRVPGKDGIIYAAPDFIYHYVTIHGYRPPEEFIEAVEKIDFTTR